jgi:hypothetical protein
LGWVVVGVIALLFGLKVLVDGRRVTQVADAGFNDAVLRWADDLDRAASETSDADLAAELRRKATNARNRINERML